MMAAFVLPYAAYLSLDLRALVRTGAYENGPARALKLACVVAIAALTWVPGPGAGDVWLLRLAFVLIVAGDLLFSVMKRFVAGVAVFGLVQVVCVARHGLRFDAPQAVIAGACAVVGGALYLGIHRRLRARGLAAPVGAYIALSGVSVAAAAGQLLRPEVPFDVALRSTVGIGLLAACDASIGARTALDGAPRQWLGFATWVLYLPALLALASSGPTAL